MNLWKLAKLLVIVVACLVSAKSISSADLFPFLRDLLHFESGMGFAAVVQKIADVVQSFLPAPTVSPITAPSDILPGPYYDFLPRYVGTVLPGHILEWNATCFSQSSLSIKMVESGALLQFSARDRSAILCSDSYLIATVSGVHFHSAVLSGETAVYWDFESLTPAELDDIYSVGFRVFRFRDSLIPALNSLFSTVMLFVPCLLSPSVPAFTAKANAAFLKDYAGMDMVLRPVNHVPLSEKDIHSGDVIAILRLDGLDPLIVWGLGGGSGHQAIALRINGVLNICEAQTITPYWPLDGIQCNPYQEWINMAYTADYNAVLLPLKPKYRALFDEKKALRFFQENQGLSYGFFNFLFGWIDFEESNYPYPVNGHLHQLLPAFLEKVGLQDYATMIWNTAFNVRLNTSYLHVADIYAEARRRDLSFTDLITSVEYDNMMYPQKNVVTNAQVSGRSMVCNVFVCSMMKAAGVFGGHASSIQCGESTPWDIIASEVFDRDAARPSRCVTADPDLPYCQLMGTHRLDFGPFYGTRPLSGPTLFQKCPRGVPPFFEKPINC